MSVARFGSFEGRDVYEVTLAAPSGAEAKVITWGAVLRDLLVPGAGGLQRVVLGLGSIEDYVAHSPYFGAIVGRHANRIGGAQFGLDGEVHRLVPNWKERHQLHGGPAGFGRRLWTLIESSASSATLALVSEDGDMGYPGRLVATCTYTLLEPATLRVSLEATCDRTTPVSLTTHSYYNLDGSPDIGEHTLTIAADFVTPTDADLIPTGAIAPVAGTPLDLRAPRAIYELNGADRTLFDINYVLRREQGAFSHAATLASGRSGIAMELWTSEPGVQFYDGHLINIPVAGLGGARYGRHAGLCLEPQRFPDGPNKPHFPSCWLEPGRVSRQVSELRFMTAA